MSEGVEVEARGDLLIVTESRADFVAIYVKHRSGPQLTLMRRTPTDDYTLLAQAWQAANDKARELGWIG